MLCSAIRLAFLLVGWFYKPGSPIWAGKCIGAYIMLHTMTSSTKLCMCCLWAASLKLGQVACCGKFIPTWPYVTSCSTPLLLILISYSFRVFSDFILIYFLFWLLDSWEFLFEQLATIGHDQPFIFHAHRFLLMHVYGYWVIGGHMAQSPHATCTTLPWALLFPCFCLSDHHYI